MDYDALGKADGILFPHTTGEKDKRTALTLPTTTPPLVKDKIATPAQSASTAT
jgi:hypothetical protein